MGMENNISTSTKSLTNFNGATSITVRTIDLDVYSPLVINLKTFMIIFTISLYNGILGRSWICKIDAITSATHEKVRYLISRGEVGQMNIN